MFYNDEYKLHVPTQEQNDFMKDAYQGGSCQIYYKGHMKNMYIESYDFNSSYPNQMMKEYGVGPYKQIEYNYMYDG